MAWNGIPVVDGDGHVMEDWDALLQYMPEPYIKSGRFKGRIFPPLDHLHSASLFQLVPGAFRQVREDGWLEFMEDVGIERAVLYSTGGLAFGKVITREFAVDVARAWNNWFADTYLKKKPALPRFGVDPAARARGSGEGNAPRGDRIEFLRRHAAVHRFQRPSGR